MPAPKNNFRNAQRNWNIFSPTWNAPCTITEEQCGVQRLLFVERGAESRMVQTGKEEFFYASRASF
jgi:hypothetical protein